MASQQALTDHKQIRRWAEERGATPACVRGSGDSLTNGELRLDVPGAETDDTLTPLTWDQWFEAFEQQGLALRVEDEADGVAVSNVSSLVARSS